MKHPDTKTRIQLNRELRDLADLREEGNQVSPGRKSYLSNPDEKMAAGCVGS